MLLDSQIYKCINCSKIVRAHAPVCLELIDFIRPDLPVCVHFVMVPVLYGGERVPFLKKRGAGNV